MSKISRRKRTKRRKGIADQGKPNFIRVKQKKGTVFLGGRGRRGRRG